MPKSAGKPRNMETVFQIGKSSYRNRHFRIFLITETTQDLHHIPLDKQKGSPDRWFQSQETSGFHQNWPERHGKLTEFRRKTSEIGRAWTQYFGRNVFEFFRWLPAIYHRKREGSWLEVTGKIQRHSVRNTASMFQQIQSHFGHIRLVRFHLGSCVSSWSRTL